jgi:ComF family protein
MWCDSIHAAALFQGPVREAIHQLKYNKRPFLAASCATVMQPMANGLPLPDVVMPVPLSVRRLRERRYNQSALLARPVARALHVPIVDDVVMRAHVEMHQVGLNAETRWENVQGQFSVADARSAQLRDLHVLVIDDVVTTGATLNALARVLKKSGAAAVHALTLAQTV